MSVTFSHVTIRYGDVIAVEDASAEFPRGAVGLLGRNGAGKSSILKALLGLLRPTAGEIEILSMSPRARGEEIRRRVGYMPEKDCYISALNGYETVRLAAQLTGVPDLDASRRAHEVLYLVGLDEQRYRPVSGYSSGMRQKVKLATALVHDPEILFLDEPTNGLDPGGRVEMLALIESLVRQLDKSVVLSSHILPDVERVCAHVVLLERGRVLRAGPLEEITRSDVRVWHLDATGDAALLRAALARRGVTQVEDRGDGHLRLTMPVELATDALFAAVVEAGGVVHRLVEHRRSLEEVFLGEVAGAGASA